MVFIVAEGLGFLEWETKEEIGVNVRRRKHVMLFSINWRLRVLTFTIAAASPPKRIDTHNAPSTSTLFIDFFPADFMISDFWFLPSDFNFRLRFLNVSRQQPITETKLRLAQSLKAWDLLKIYYSNVGLTESLILVEKRMPDFQLGFRIYGIQVLDSWIWFPLTLLTDP